MPEVQLRNFLEIPYDQLKKFNLKIKQMALRRSNDKEIRNYYREVLKKEKNIKAVTLCFTDIEGKFHMLDYDKDFFLSSEGNLTFDGSSVQGLASLGKSDLRLIPDWYSFRFLPSDIFGRGKVLLFAFVADQQKNFHLADFRSKLFVALTELKKKKNMNYQMSVEPEGFLIDGQNSEQNFDEKRGFKLVSQGGYFHSLPISIFRKFIDRSAEAQRALAFENEKDHPEVAPSQFEINYSYTDALIACDQVQLCKLICRQVAHSMGLTATFLPKPFAGINGSGMHINLSLQKEGQNLFYSAKNENNLSQAAIDFASRILNHAKEICLVLNSSVNAYRRLDPKFEAPNQIRISPVDRGAMIRIPMGNEKSARLELRSVAPDANPYLASYALLEVGLRGGMLVQETNKRFRTQVLPGSIGEAIRYFKQSNFISKILGETTRDIFVNLKQRAANRSPSELGTKIKNGEILYHHEVANQVLWNGF